MRLILNILLLIGCAVVIYLIYSNIKEPIVFEQEYTKRQDAVTDQLEKIRDAQEVYKSIKGEYASSFDELKSVLKTEDVSIYKIVGDIDNEDVETQIDTLYVPARDTLKTMGVSSIDSLDYVPYGAEGAEFSIAADTLTYQQTLVNVVEVGIRKGEYMGKFDDPKYSRYNNQYDPNDIVKFGDLNSPNTSGNWR